MPNMEKDGISGNDFDRWNLIKKRMETKGEIRNLYPKEKDVWICALGKNIGFEQDGSDDNFLRPMLIVKKFNNQMFWAVPLTSKQKSYDFYYNFTDPSGKKGSLILAQMRLISIKRCESLLYVLPHSLFQEAKERLRKYLR